MRIAISLAIFAMSAAVCAPARAIEVQYKASFSAAAFIEAFGRDVSPVSVVSGSIDYSADENTNIVSRLDAISLSIDGHIYSLAEIGIISHVNSVSNLFGGVVSGVGGSTSGTNDFALSIPRVGAPPSTFGFTTSSRPVSSYNATQLSFSVSTVSEPAAVAMFCIGAISIGAAVRRNR